ncbi:hypothetical protein [Nocardia crassostreae]|nr:hypothetical protein [Nocardia crassostreae]
MGESIPTRQEVADSLARLHVDPAVDLAAAQAAEAEARRRSRDTAA